MQLAMYSDELPREYCVRLLPSCRESEPGGSPFLQFAYDEISGLEIDRLLGYAGICAANAPIGLDYDAPARFLGADSRNRVLLFPLAGLEKHLMNQEPEIAELLRKLGSLDDFVENRGDAMTAIEYLTAGVLACIRFCTAHGQALTITW